MHKMVQLGVSLAMLSGGLYAYDASAGCNPLYGSTFAVMSSVLTDYCAVHTGGGNGHAQGGTSSGHVWLNVNQDSGCGPNYITHVTVTGVTASGNNAGARCFYDDTTADNASVTTSLAHAGECDTAVKYYLDMYCQ